MNQMKLLVFQAAAKEHGRRIQELVQEGVI